MCEFTPLCSELLPCTLCTLRSKDAEIARLKSENERLTAERDEAVNQRATIYEDHKRRVVNQREQITKLLATVEGLKGTLRKERRDRGQEEGADTAAPTTSEGGAPTREEGEAEARESARADGACEGEAPSLGSVEEGLGSEIGVRVRRRDWASPEDALRLELARVTHKNGRMRGELNRLSRLVDELRACIANGTPPGEFAWNQNHRKVREYARRMSAAEAQVAELTAAKEAAEREQYLDRQRGNVQQERAEAAEAERDALRERLAKVEAARKLLESYAQHSLGCVRNKKITLDCTCGLQDIYALLAEPATCGTEKPAAASEAGTCATCAPPNGDGKGWLYGRSGEAVVAVRPCSCLPAARGGEGKP